jgi:DNA-binding winged helix-turn-helix (wHTH) protein/TolB-like protein
VLGESIVSRVRFGTYEADLSSGELWRDGAPVPLQDLPARLLALLLERPGELVTRTELTARLWGADTFVDATAGVNTAIAKLRDALGDDAESPTFVETVPKRGYRFIAPVERINRTNGTDATADSPPARAEPQVEPAAPSTRAQLEASPSPGAEDTPSTPTADSEPQVRRDALPRPLSRSLVWAAAAAVVVVVGALAAYQLNAARTKPRIAVVLFDNETGRAELGPLAQGLTDATVTELTRDPRLAVIGNAAVLRTSRPFRDIAAVRDALDADFIVIGQVQMRDGAVLVRAHLIRSTDQSHLWVGAVGMSAAGEAALQDAIASRIRAAVSTHALGSS